MTDADPVSHPRSGQHAGRAWYEAPRAAFLEHTAEAISRALLQAAVQGGYFVEVEQEEEWRRSVQLLREGMTGRRQGAITALRGALASPAMEEISHVILEYDFRRRGLRLDAVLLAPGLVLVLEFKRSRLDASARDQVLHYCVTLAEFHEATRSLLEQGAVIVPVLVQSNGALRLAEKDSTRGEHGPEPDAGARATRAARLPGADAGREERWLSSPWSAIWGDVLRCGEAELGSTLLRALGLRRSSVQPVCRAWVDSRFDPSSSIVDAAIALYGQHEVSAIREHASPLEEIRAVTEAVATNILQARVEGRPRVVLISGAPGAGKTLVALNLAFDPRFRRDAVFVTGNAPLVEVLEAALQASYRDSRRARSTLVSSGYPTSHAVEAIRSSTFKIVKAHRFLGERGETTGSADGSIVLFDEAQRTYEKGREVVGKRLANHEADLILAALEASYDATPVLVAVLGQHQAINTGERGAVAWFQAAEARGWRFAVSDATLSLSELNGGVEWAGHPLRIPLAHGHLGHSMRFYRNAGIERWVHHVLSEELELAAAVAATLDAEGHTVWLTRSLERGKAWIRAKRVGEERAGMVASAQARRLAAIGLQVELKPGIAMWMLAPSGDPRSSNMLETVQNQYQIQGLELDWVLVAWGADLRRGAAGWESFKLVGPDWRRDRALEVSKNGYRVLLTRARKGMVIVVPEGDRTGGDSTRRPRWYDATHEWLIRCGARALPG